MAEQFLETDQGFINARFIERIWWDKHSDGWAAKQVGSEQTLFPRSEDAVHELLGTDPLG